MDNIIRMLDGQPLRNPQQMPDDGSPFTDESLMPFGKFAGTKLKELPMDYVDWMCLQPEMKNQRLNVYLKGLKKKAGDQVESQIEAATESDDVPF